jgi:hypothetical protein
VDRVASRVGSAWLKGSKEAWSEIHVALTVAFREFRSIPRAVFACLLASSGTPNPLRALQKSFAIDTLADRESSRARSANFRTRHKKSLSAHLGGVVWRKNRDGFFVATTTISKYPTTEGHKSHIPTVH